MTTPRATWRYQGQGTWHLRRAATDGGIVILGTIEQLGVTWYWWKAANRIGKHRSKYGAQLAVRRALRESEEAVQQCRAALAAIEHG
jgi:hypothetical protein